MKFGSLKPEQSKGGILAHSITLSNHERLRKGQIMDDETIAKLIAAGIKEVVIAMPEHGDILENDAATQIASQFATHHLRIEKASTGRVNIFAASNGIFCISSKIINALNLIDPGITIATLPDYASVNEGRLVATIKIIPYAVQSASLDQVLALDLPNAIEIKAYKPKKIGLISTKLSVLKSSVMDKTSANLEKRLALSGSLLIEELRVEHNAQSVAEAIGRLSPKCDILILFSASAICDIADCIPDGIERAGGENLRFGMPVDPGNLILLAKMDDQPIVGAPGCSRSIAENGFDWVLNRLLADIKVSSSDIANMGVGGLLMETGSRPHPREIKQQTQHKTAGIILAAGQSRRMGKLNKMTTTVKGKPMVRHVAEAACTSKLQTVSIVTGHKPQEVINVLDELEINQVNNPDYEKGLSTSLSAGIRMLGADVSHVIVILGDMPMITSQMINRLIDQSSTNPNHIIVSTHKGKRGNPVLWPRSFFGELQSIEGDTGARHIMAANRDRLIEVELGEAASLDLDTPEAVRMVENLG